MVPPRGAGVIVAAGLLAACASPVERIESYARAQGYERVATPAGPTRVVAFYNPAAQQLRRAAAAHTAIVHVYLEGDGMPWINGTQVAADPTPRDPLALRLMSRDPQPSVYLTRPCAHGDAHAEGCNPLLWTHARYGVAVVERMTSAVRRAIADLGQSRAVLIGYSGGGVLAMLVAPQLPQVRGVVTVAANLDTEAWARLHDYSPLAGSLNPARQPALAADVFQLHLAGGRDTNVPVTLISAAVAHQPAAAVEVFEEFDHACCWESVWPDVLDRLASREGAL